MHTEPAESLTLRSGTYYGECIGYCSDALILGPEKTRYESYPSVEGPGRPVRMVEEDTGCVEVLTQISAIHEALRGVGKVVVRHHIETCVTEGLQTGERQRHQDELMDLIYKLSK